MKKIDRYNLMDKIGRELQSRMSYNDINAYLSNFGVSINKETSSVNSKWVYVKDLLVDVDMDTIIDIADELEIDHGFANGNLINVKDTVFWKPNHFRLFLSHLSSYKEKTALLQKSLYKYGVSSFVAHEDIEPTKQWLEEIEKALFSMDALAAILTLGFNNSNWTDHEVGVAVGRGCLVIPIRKGLDPYGFIGKYQGFQAEGKTVEEVANGIFYILARNKKTSLKLFDALADLFILSNDVVSAFEYLRLIKSIENFPVETMMKIKGNVKENKVLLDNDFLLEELNRLFIKFDIEKVSKESYIGVNLSTDDLPF